MNDRFEKEVKGLLSKHLGGVILSEQTKRHIKNNMTESLSRRRLPFRERLVMGLREFWHSTYEISIAPAALTGAAAVMLVLLAVYPGFAPARKPLNNEIVYIQSIIEQNGTRSVIYLPISMEVNSDANN